MSPICYTQKAFLYMNCSVLSGVEALAKEIPTVVWHIRGFSVNSRLYDKVVFMIK